MNNKLIGLFLTAIFGIGLLIWGIYGIMNRDRIRSRADFILSVGQVIGGIMAFAYLIIYFTLRVHSQFID